MNYYEARQRKDEKWDFTGANDGRIFVHACCRDHAGTHLTKDEAERCFYEWNIKRFRVGTASDQQCKCKVCGAWTSKFVEQECSLTFLCDEHANEDGVRQVNPFKSGITIISSY